MSMSDRLYQIKIDSLEYGSTFLSGYFGTDVKARKLGMNNLNEMALANYILLYTSYNNSFKDINRCALDVHLQKYTLNKLLLVSAL